MSRLLGDLFVAAGLLWWVFAVVIAVGVGVLWPLMAWSAVRSLKGIRRELEQLNASVERMPRRAAMPGHDDSPLGDEPIYIPGTHTRTGPLHIR